MEHFGLSGIFFVVYQVVQAGSTADSKTLVGETLSHVRHTSTTTQLAWGGGVLKMPMGVTTPRWEDRTGLLGFVARDRTVECFKSGCLTN